MSLFIRRTVTSLNTVLMGKKWCSGQVMNVNKFHKNHQILSQKNLSSELSIPYFAATRRKEKDAFLEIIRIYRKDDVLLVRQIPFIMLALKYVDQFGVNKDLEVYKAIMDVFPKGKYIATNSYQVLGFHYGRHQNTAMEILTKMEENNVIPDYEMQELVLNIFGIRSIVIKKLWRMVYWMSKFSRLNPWPVPHNLKDPKELAKLAIEKISSADVQAKVTIYSTKDLPEAVEDTWIISAMSPSQEELLAVQPTNKSLTIEGPFFIWIGTHCLDYFVLKGDPIKREIIYEDYDDVSDMKMPFWKRHHFGIPVTMHEQSDGVYYAMCATGTSSKSSLVSWIRCLQKTNAILETIPIVFKLKSSSEQILSIEGGETTPVEQHSSENKTTEAT